MNTTRFMGYDPEDPEFASVEAFVEMLMDDDVVEFDAGQLQCLNANLRRPAHEIRRELEGYGLTLAERRHERRVRGFNSNPHDRWSGPGSCASHGGSGWSQIIGFAGQEG